MKIETESEFDAKLDEYGELLATIKDYVKGLADADETLAALGLTLTEPSRHAEVKPLHT